MSRIFYFCPDRTVRSAGIRTLYRHISHLNRNGIDASILHEQQGFRVPDSIPVPISYLNVPNTISAGDIIVLPEAFENLMRELKDQPVRKIIICQNWKFIFEGISMGTNWRAMNIERALTYGKANADFISWSMQIPVHTFDWGLRDDLFYSRPADKIAQISFVVRKQNNVEILARMLHARNPQYVENIRWLGMDQLSEVEYAAEMRRSVAFLNLSTTEGLYAPYLEAMRCGTLVIGYNAVGAREMLVGSGPGQNCITAENEDYFGLAQQMEPFLQDLLRRDISRWEPVIRNGTNYAARFTMEREEQSVVNMWREILAMGTQGAAGATNSNAGLQPQIV